MLHTLPKLVSPVDLLYRIAGRSVLADVPLSQLGAFARATPHVAVRGCSPTAQAHSKISQTVFCGPGWIGNEWRQVRARANGQGYELDIEGVGTLFVAGDGKAIRTDKVAPSCEQRLLEEALLGPALILALALDGAFCLHASAAAIDGRAVAFLGDSGSGKSTLAHYLGARRSEGWQLVADDILPVAAAAQGLDVLPHFPQLKMPPDRQPAEGQPERLPLAAIVLLDETRAPDGAEIGAERLRSSQGMLALVRHTVAARLFDQALLARHLGFCADAALMVPVWRLGYPHRRELLPRVAGMVADCMGAGEKGRGAAWSV